MIQLQYQRIHPSADQVAPGQVLKNLSFRFSGIDGRGNGNYKCNR